MLPLLAVTANSTPLEKLQNVSGQFWIKVILAIFAFALLIFLFRKVMGMNKIFLIIICGVILGVVGFSWIYNRNEPAFLTPIIEPIANSGFFPTKGAYEGKQQQDPTRPGLQKNPPSTKPAANSTTPTTPSQPAKK